ncbi:inositol monophosphatase family protein [Coraliomargarita sp. SDUM461004]|uniref:Inositol-1-monophosphatase n=1 Tax=Thalassobacterium sedimentorum TaxID=3041258 RepID=A0ABU1AEU1_9BACT|nr:inositol monophosphatase family protein [Coraliomargarita sp. SDUM461004]MDQ8193287.1 inositol monophosphatase family protein [Coraliomargarita sp. SDUM461004]
MSVKLSNEVSRELLRLAERAAKEAGTLLHDAYATDAGVQSMAGRDIKTEADQAAEQHILEKLRPSGYSILAEESGFSSAKLSREAQRSLRPSLIMNELEPMWIIDPLDGTFNFTRGFPACCVSIALWGVNKPLLGVIYDFASDMMYSGIVGQGAACNGKPIFVSNTKELHHAALATGFPSGRDFSHASLLSFVERVQQFKKIRMIGSAALSHAYVASGRVDAYFEEDIWLWDVAAGLALVEAAGGDFTISEIKDSWQLTVMASNSKIPFSL